MILGLLRSVARGACQPGELQRELDVAVGGPEHRQGLHAPLAVMGARRVARVARRVSENDGVQSGALLTSPVAGHIFADCHQNLDSLIAAEYGVDRSACAPELGARPREQSQAGGVQLLHQVEKHVRGQEENEAIGSLGGSRGRGVVTR